MMLKTERRSHRRRGMTLLEAVTACLVVSILLVAAMRAVGAANVYQSKTADRAAARQLASGMLADIMQLYYEEPNGTVAFGLETGESSTSKTNYDDVDDFNGWSETPPQDRSGSAMTEFSGWTRCVVVQWVSATDGSTVSATETGVKKVSVTASKGNVSVTVVALKTKAP